MWLDLCYTIYAGIEKERSKREIDVSSAEAAMNNIAYSMSCMRYTKFECILGFVWYAGTYMLNFNALTNLVAVLSVFKQTASE